MAAKSRGLGVLINLQSSQVRIAKQGRSPLGSPNITEMELEWSSAR